MQLVEMCINRLPLRGSRVAARRVALDFFFYDLCYPSSGTDFLVMVIYRCIARHYALASLNDKRATRTEYINGWLALLLGTNYERAVIAAFIVYVCVGHIYMSVVNITSGEYITNYIHTRSALINGRRRKTLYTRCLLNISALFR